MENITSYLEKNLKLCARRGERSGHEVDTPRTASPLHVLMYFISQLGCDPALPLRLFIVLHALEPRDVQLHIVGLTEEQT